jgi:hypothetical protein
MLYLKNVFEVDIENPANIKIQTRLAQHSRKISNKTDLEIQFLKTLILLFRLAGLLVSQTKNVSVS